MLAIGAIWGLRKVIKPCEVGFTHGVGMSYAKQSLPENQEQVKFPAELHPSKESIVKEGEMCDRWVAYMGRLHAQKYILVNDEEKLMMVSRGSYSSRYTRQGQRKRVKRLKVRYGNTRFKNSVLLGLTYDPKRVSRYDAWGRVNEDFRGWMDRVNKLRARRGMKRRLIYCHSIEEQPTSRYPHLHVAFPGLKFLGVKAKKLEKMWGWGSGRVESYRGVDAVRYVSKYVLKGGTSPLMMAYMYNYGLRQYSFSRGFGVANSSVCNVSKWKFFKFRWGEDEESDLEFVGFWFGYRLVDARAAPGKCEGGVFPKYPVFDVDRMIPPTPPPPVDEGGEHAPNEVSGRSPLEARAEQIEGTGVGSCRCSKL